MLYIELAKFPDHFLVLVVTDDDWRYALISVEALPNTPCHDLVMKDIGWLDVKRIHGEDIVVSHRPHVGDPVVGQKRKRGSVDGALEPPSMGYFTPRYRDLFALWRDANIRSGLPWKHKCSGKYTHTVGKDRMLWIMFRTLADSPCSQRTSCFLQN